MKLLRFYFLIGGIDFQASKYSENLMKKGMDGGVVKYLKNRKIPSRSGQGVVHIVESGLPGASGDGYNAWMSEVINYEVDENVYLNKSISSMGWSNYAKIWKSEEDVICEFLINLAKNLEPVENYCEGEYFSLLKLMYGDDNGGGIKGFLFSNRMIECLFELGAGVEADVVDELMHFSKLKS